MLSLNELIPEEKRRLNDLESQLFELERGNKIIQVADIRIAIVELGRRLSVLDDLADKEPKNRRAEGFRRIQHLKNIHENIKSSLDKVERMRLQNDYELQKQELFGKVGMRDPALVDLEMAENSSLTKSNAMMNDYLNSSKETLAELVSQRERLKSVQTKVLDILNLLGISNSIMKSVERRDYYDKLLVFSGMIVTLIVLCLVYFYLR
jgi:golgi SNAP receptor complex member 2